MLLFCRVCWFHNYTPCDVDAPGDIDDITVSVLHICLALPVTACVMTYKQHTLGVIAHCVSSIGVA